MITTTHQQLLNMGTIFDWTPAKPYEIYVDVTGDYWITRLHKIADDDDRECVQYRVLRIRSQWYTENHDIDTMWSTVTERKSLENQSAYAPFTPIRDHQIDYDLLMDDTPAEARDMLYDLQARRDAR